MKCPRCHNTMNRMKIDAHIFEYRCPKCKFVIKGNTQKSVSTENAEVKNDDMDAQ